MLLAKWIGTILCLIGIGLTAFNIYPSNVYYGIAGSAIWAAVGLYQRDAPLFLVEAVAVAFYFIGIITWITK
jgi:hypothetical protein